MELKETILKTQSASALLEDTEYYKYIFKKTEKMACAVFYIVRGDVRNGHKDSVVSDLEAAAQALLAASLESLKSTGQSREEHAHTLRHALISFESKLRVANAARVLPTELLEVFIHEVDSVQRSLRKYAEPAVANPFLVAEASFEPVRERKPVARVKLELGQAVQTHTGAPAGAPVGQSRRDRVLNVLRDKGEATIKDIVEVVTDCSEKTIQRELISLIKDNVVSREGERRWSKYKLV